MKQKINWHQIAQGSVVLLCAIALKFYYSQASANQLQWILAPTAMLVELVSGISFTFESYSGYVSRDRSFLIAPVCAGVNFLIAAFLMLSMSRLFRKQPQSNTWGFIPVAAVIAYLVTLVANTVRITVALWLRQLPENSWLNPVELHRVEGILVYSCFLLLLFMVSEKISNGKSSGLLRQSVFPLLMYYAITLGIPLINGGYRQGISFWQHSAFVLLIPLLLILPLMMFGWMWRQVNKEGRENNIRVMESK